MAPNGTAIQLVSEGFILALAAPQFPVRGHTYGLLSWLNAPRGGNDTRATRNVISRERDIEAAASTAGPACCAPRWGPTATCDGVRLAGDLIGDDIGATASETAHHVAPSTLVLAMGWLGQYFMVDTATATAVVSMGATWGASQQCRLGASRLHDPSYNGATQISSRLLPTANTIHYAHTLTTLYAYTVISPLPHTDGYDDAWSATQVWRAIAPALKPVAAHRELARNEDDSHTATEVHTDEQQQVAERSNATGANVVGSCSCKCPPGRDFGSCYNILAGSAAAKSHTCAPIATRAAMDCKPIGVTMQCATNPAVSSDGDCDAAALSIRGDVGNIHVWGGRYARELSFLCIPSLFFFSFPPSFHSPVPFFSLPYFLSLSPSLL